MARTLGEIEENSGAAALELTPQDLREIEGAVSKITVQGPAIQLNRLVGR